MGYNNSLNFITTLFQHEVYLVLITFYFLSLSGIVRSYIYLICIYYIVHMCLLYILLHKLKYIRQFLFICSHDFLFPLRDQRLILMTFSVFSLYLHREHSNACGFLFASYSIVTFFLWHHCLEVSAQCVLLTPWLCKA